MSYHQTPIVVQPIDQEERMLSAQIEYIKVKIEESKKLIERTRNDLSFVHQDYVANSRKLKQINSILETETDPHTIDKLSTEVMNRKLGMQDCDKYIEHHEKLIEEEKNKMAKLQSQLKKCDMDMQYVFNGLKKS